MEVSQGLATVQCIGKPMQYPRYSTWQPLLAREPQHSRRQQRLRDRAGLNMTYS